MNLDLVIVGTPFDELKESIPECANVYVEEFEQKTTNNKTWGYNKALNKGVRKGYSDFIGLCNNDLIFHSTAVNKLVHALSTYDSVSPWCPSTHSDWWVDHTPSSNVQGYQVGKVIAGWCIFIRRETWNILGGLDERLGFWCSDNAYSEQLKRTNLTHALIPSAKVTHLQSQTLKTIDKSKYREYTSGEIRKFEQVYNKKLR